MGESAISIVNSCVVDRWTETCVVAPHSGSKNAIYHLLSTDTSNEFDVYIVHSEAHVTRATKYNIKMTGIVFVFTALLTYLLYPPADALPREFYCYRMCRNALNKCMEKSCKGKFPALVPVECLAKHTDCNEKCGFMSTMLKYHLDSEKPPVRLRLVE
ncbi:hypothetical protein NP493_460g00019 [Ridgeia piscesae]|uniref:Uncharacterized protein n=1 Tax=Ridgeia piscesae TaxID=27915 RepID=A0AAD9KZ85_RIDPI|nr:hypothetical protein NP493_460g00019 [Ridgeia piscesae]